MTNHLVPPFMMREAGITVNDTSKVQLDDSDVSDHSIIFDESNLG